MYDTIEKRNELYNDAITAWGWQAQVNMANEELAECIVALQKLFNRDWSLKRLEELAGEIADVTIMLEEVKLIIANAQADGAVFEGQTQTFQEMIDAQIQYKLERTRQRIDALQGK
ncbi:hypothetical protein AAY80_088 [Stenotrophomonas phage vB_SmaS-DLP_6]|nr:hypothetical protein AAY80_088 [Stenotrophomonas phage vB_SmaS-DLP_6]